MSKKLSDTDPEGDRSVTKHTPTEKDKEGGHTENEDKSSKESDQSKQFLCCVCGKNEGVKRCSGCKSAHYCSKD